MATSILSAPGERPIDSRQTPAFATCDIDITRLYRAFISQDNWRRPELTAFVEAHSRGAAARKIAEAVALIEIRRPDEVTERIYNLAHATELIAENVSDDHAARLFECGWSGGRVIAWVSAPLVLLADPEPLLRVWARLLVLIGAEK